MSKFNNDLEMCACGHERKYHKNNEGVCSECDREAAFGMNSNCSRFHIAPRTSHSVKKSLEERVSNLEKKFAMFLKTF